MDIVDGFIEFENNNDITQAYIPIESLKYFRIKRPAPTFDDLIDVAVEAVKDKLIIINAITDWQIQFVRGSDTRYVVSHDHSRISEEIDFINSLYTETFVIESESNLWDIKKGADGVLVNGSKFTVFCGAKNMFDEPNDVAITVNFKGMTHNELLYFNPLKGATVTQKRGRI